MPSAGTALGRLSAECRGSWRLGGGCEGKVFLWSRGGCVKRYPGGRCLRARRGSEGLGGLLCGWGRLPAESRAAWPPT